MNKVRKLKALLIIFLMLTIIKFFTAKVGLLSDPTVQLVIKSNPTFSNSFIMKGEDNKTNRDKYKGTWYYEGKYKVITGDESGFKGESVYNLLIFAWWISGIGMPIYMFTIRMKSRIHPCNVQLRL